MNNFCLSFFIVLEKLELSKIRIEIKDNATNVVTPVRKIPLTLKPKLEKELKQMVDLDIIEPI